MSPWVQVLVSAVEGIVLGALGLCVFPILLALGSALYNTFVRRAYGNEGMVVLILPGTALLGGLLGGIAGAAIALSGLEHFRAAGWTCLIGGGVVAGAWAWLSWVAKENEEGKSIRSFLFWLVNPGFGVPPLWALALIIWGSRLLSR